MTTGAPSPSWDWDAVAAMTVQAAKDNDEAMAAILRTMTPERRAELALLGAYLVEMCNEIGGVR